MQQSIGKPVEILLVEDNPADVRLMQEAFREGEVRNSMSVVADGMAAMSFLRREGIYGDAPRPNLILLDLNLPRKNGHEVLAEIKLDAKLRAIPVVVLTTSSASEDVLAAYNLHANCYITKPADVARFFQVVNSVNDFWLHTARLPDGDFFDPA